MWGSLCEDKVSWREVVSVPREENLGLRNSMIETASVVSIYTGKDVELLQPFGEQTASNSPYESAQREAEMDRP